MRELGRDIPAPIQVLSDQVASVVPEEHPVGIDHRHDFENEVLPQYGCYGVAADEELDEALADERSHRFASMDTRQNHNHANGALRV